MLDICTAYREDSKLEITIKKQNFWIDIVTISDELSVHAAEKDMMITGVTKNGVCKSRKLIEIFYNQC